MDGLPALTPIKTGLLSILESAFLKGFMDDEVRTSVLMSSTSISISRSLQTAYEAAEDVKSSLERLQEVERERGEKKELESFRAQYRGWNLLLYADLAGLDKNKHRIAEYRIKFPGRCN